MFALSAASWRSNAVTLAAGLSLYLLQAWASTRGITAQVVVAWLCIEVAFNIWQSWRYVSVSNVEAKTPTPVQTGCTL